MSRLLLLDGNSLAYRAFYALPAENFSTSTGQHTNAVYGFTAMLINVLRDEEPTHVAVAFDVSRETFRSAEYSEYKAGRAKSPSEFSGQIPLVKEILDALRIRHVEVPGFEADDVIATLTTQAVEAGVEVVLCTGDRDAFQLVSPTVSLLYPVRGVSEVWRMDPAAVEAKYLVPPQRYSDLAALVGESSDNLPGVPGVGPKTAAKWLATFGDLTGIVAHVDQIGGKVGESLRAHLDQVLLNRRLNQLVTDLDVPVAIADLERAAWDREEVHRVFDALEFRVLRDRLFSTFDAAAEEVSQAVDVAGERWGSADVVAALGLAAPDRGVERGLTTVTSAGAATALALAEAGGSSAFIALDGLDADATSALTAYLADPDAPKVMHDAKSQLHALKAAGMPLGGLALDTAVAAYLIRPDQRSYDLTDLAVRVLGRSLTAEVSEAPQGLLDFATDDREEMDSAVARARACADLAEPLRSQVQERGGAALLTDLELPLIGVLAQMERVGIAVDEGVLTGLEADFAAAVREAQEDAWESIGRRDVNLGSPKQLQEVLFDQLGLPKTRRTKTGYTTDAEALADLFVKTEHPFLEALLRHRDAARLRVTVEGLLKSVADDGRIHTTFLQTVAATGRLSSTEPNLQNVPIRTDEGRRIRDAFVVGEGYASLMSADYSQIELRIMAHLSGDAALIEAFRSGEDLHRYVGSQVFAVAPEDVTAQMRSKIKAMSYGLAYGLSAFGLSRQLTISTEEARGLMDMYFERFGGIKSYLGDIVAQARATGYTETMLGRRRYLPDLTSDNRQRREMAERMALNAPIQGSAADIMKRAMIDVSQALSAEDLRTRVLLQVHDELLLEVAPGEEERASELVRSVMGSGVEMDLPLDVSIGIGRTWNSAAH